MEELVIDSGNFDQYFLDARAHPPQPGMVLAKFVAYGDLIDGEDNLKKDIIEHLKNVVNGGKSAINLLQKVAGVREKEAVKVLLEISRDIHTMNEEEVLDKPYRFVCEFFFYAKREHVPVNDPHWETIQLIDAKWENFEEAISSMKDIS